VLHPRSRLDRLDHRAGGGPFSADQRVRFHAFQGLYLFVAWLIVDQVLRPVFNSLSDAVRVDRIFEAVLMFTWIFMLVKASHDEAYSLPIIETWRRSPLRSGSAG